MSKAKMCINGEWFDAEIKDLSYEIDCPIEGDLVFTLPTSFTCEMELSEEAIDSFAESLIESGDLNILDARIIG